MTRPKFPGAPRPTATLRSRIDVEIVASRAQGVTVAQLVAATGGNPHTVYAIASKLGADVVRLRRGGRQGGQVVYIARGFAPATVVDGDPAPPDVSAIVAAVRELAGDDGASALDVAEVVGGTSQEVGRALSRLVKVGALRALRNHGRITRYVVAPPIVGHVGPALPMLEAGQGERRDDCVNYADCLGRLTKSRAGQLASFARCAAACGSYEATSREEALAMATMRRRAQGEA